MQSVKAGARLLLLPLIPGRCLRRRRRASLPPPSGKPSYLLLCAPLKRFDPARSVAIASALHVVREEDFGKNGYISHERH